MAFHPDWCDRDETGMIGTVSGMKTPESGMKTPENGMKTPENGMKTPENGMKTPENGMKTPENGVVGDSRRGTGSGCDCFKMFKTIVVNRESCHSWMEV